MPPPDRGDTGLAKLLSSKSLGRFSVPLANLEATSTGRPLHETGVLAIRDSIEAQGWLGSKMTVSLIGDVPEAGLTPEVASTLQYRLINGNHRKAALDRLHAENIAAIPPRQSIDVIEVDVLAGLSVENERHIAASECLACLRVRA